MPSLQTHLQESDFSRMFSETLPTYMQSILSDQTMPIGTHTTRDTEDIHMGKKNEQYLYHTVRH